VSHTGGASQEAFASSVCALFEANLEFFVAEANLDSTAISFAGSKLVTALFQRLEQCTQDTQAALVERGLVDRRVQIARPRTVPRISHLLSAVVEPTEDDTVRI
jgi:hypothetical protein